MHEYRVTKYNPALRGPTGAYSRNEWTSVKDIGRSFDDAILTLSVYQRVEDAYVSTALAFLTEAGLTSLNVEGLENTQGQPIACHEGDVLPVERIGDVIGRVLREEFWCRLQNTAGFVHFGWDYYMYIGVPHPCPTAEALALNLGLFVEEFDSPYNAPG